ncbi:hypothetical protein SLS62_002532 [Diatrype stigma]|uniref:Uncharacterized protein n=1 Tax=Diatrype stigma TaxID=117547 RepID=A0AAN9YV01_9PEZI
MSAGESSKKLVLTLGEVDVLLNTWLCMNTKPEIDAGKLARLTKYGSTRSVTNLMTAIGKKVEDAVEDGKDLKLVTPWADGKGQDTSIPKTRKRKAATCTSAGNGGIQKASTSAKRANGSKDMSGKEAMKGVNKDAN